jgi:hypothetical protein
MKNYNLDFISNDNLYDHVKDTVDKYQVDTKIDLKEFNKNLVDPIKLTFDLKVYKKEVSSLIESEILRQLDKANTNHIGYFHQNIFKYIGIGWNVPESGYDIVNISKKYFIEMKNKHNTMNSSSSQKTYMRMQNTILKEPDSTCCLVEVIAKNSQNIVWVISLDGVQVSNDNIRRVSIDKFYELVTGDKDAFKKLCDKLPEVIDDILLNSNSAIGLSGCVLEELQQISPDILKSLYMLSFRRYEGFEKY